MTVSDDIFLSKEWKQNCNDFLLVLEKTDIKRGTNCLWKCIFKKAKVIVYKTKFEVLRGTIQVPEDIVGKIFLQKNKDSIKVLEKTNKKNKDGSYLYKGIFLKYPYTIYRSARDIKRGEILNPQIEQIKFVNKIWPQKQGDSLKILKKTNIKEQNNYLWKCSFIEKPYEILASKNRIIKGRVKNPLLEDFIGKSFEQKLYGKLKVIEKTNEKCNNEYLYKCVFEKFPSTVLAKKSNILRGEVSNSNYPDKTKELLEKYIKEHFKEKRPTIKELADSLNRGYSTIVHKINQFDLRSKIDYTVSLKEDEIRNYCLSLNKSTELKENFSVLNGQGIDVYIPNLNLGIEYNGNFWHSNSNRGVDKYYHQNKSLKAKENNIFILHIFEYEWLEKENILKSLIRSRLKFNQKKIYARCCQIKEILNYQEYAQFCNENHLQGEAGAKIKLGLYYKDELVQVMSFGKPRFTDKYEWEIIRECSKLDYKVIGGKEKIFKYFLQKYKPSNIITYCDFSKFDGKSYLQIGFKFLRLNPPGFVWYNDDLNEVYWRNPYKNQKLKAQKLLKIYDCGQLVFEWKL